MLLPIMTGLNMANKRVVERCTSLALEVGNLSMRSKQNPGMKKLGRTYVQVHNHLTQLFRRGGVAICRQCEKLQQAEAG